MGAEFESNANFRRVVDAAALAPSAENTQPWRFLLHGDRLTVCLDGARQLESDVDHMLDLTSLGACIENAVIACREMGREPQIRYLLDADELTAPSDAIPIAELSLGQLTDADPLFESLGKRCTSRRMDAARPVEGSTLAKLTTASAGYSVQVDWITDRRQVRCLSALVGLGNRIRFEHRPFHAEFYRNIRLDSQAANRTRDGLDVATLQLPFGQPMILRLMQAWRLVQLGNCFGFSRAVERQGRKETLGSGALGILSVASRKPHDFLQGGRVLERVWLNATALGLGLHPAASLPVFLAYANHPASRTLSRRHRRLVAEMKARFEGCLPHLRGRTIQMLFRLGYAEPPKMRSLRRPVDELQTICTRKAS